MINEKRLIQEFLELVKIDSPSGKEKKITQVVSDKLKDLGGKVSIDKFGNVIGKFSAICHSERSEESLLPTILLNAHLDTVTPCEGIKPIIEGNIIKSDGKTILGGDDKSGVAVILEVLMSLRGAPSFVIARSEATKQSHTQQNSPPLDIVFTVSEEIGLVGAKNLDFSLIDAKFGYSLDSTNLIITQAPSHNKIHIKIYGKEAHAGTSPDQGISAIEILSKAISKQRLGKIDDETTANIGVIKGGNATNIVAGYAEAEGEVRSHNERKLKDKTDEIIRIFKETASDFSKEIDGKVVSPKVEEEIRREYNSFHIPDDDEVVKRVVKVGNRLGFSIETKKGGGGSDANIFNKKGIKTVILGTGMSKVHTKEEFIKIEDLVLSARLLLEIITS